MAQSTITHSQKAVNRVKKEVFKEPKIVLLLFIHKLYQTIIQSKLENESS